MRASSAADILNQIQREYEEALDSIKAGEEELKRAKREVKLAERWCSLYNDDNVIDRTSITDRTIASSSNCPENKNDNKAAVLAGVIDSSAAPSSGSSVVSSELKYFKKMTKYTGHAIKTTHAEDIIALSVELEELREELRTMKESRVSLEEQLCEERERGAQMYQALQSLGATAAAGSSNGSMVMTDIVERLQKELAVERERANAADEDAAEALELTRLLCDEKDSLEMRLGQAMVELDVLQRWQKQQQQQQAYSISSPSRPPPPPPPHLPVQSQQQQQQQQQYATTTTTNNNNNDNDNNPPITMMASDENNASSLVEGSAATNENNNAAATTTTHSGGCGASLSSPSNYSHYYNNNIHNHNQQQQLGVDDYSAPNSPLIERNLWGNSFDNYSHNGKSITTDFSSIKSHRNLINAGRNILNKIQSERRKTATTTTDGSLMTDEHSSVASKNEMFDYLQKS